MANCIFLVAIFIKAISSKIKRKDMAKCSGLTAAFIKGNGEMEYKTEKVKFIWLEGISLVGCLRTVCWFK